MVGYSNERMKVKSVRRFWVISHCGDEVYMHSVVFDIAPPGGT
jgi:hypothetical protein